MVKGWQFKNEAEALNAAHDLWDVQWCTGGRDLNTMNASFLTSTHQVTVNIVNNI